MRGICCLSDIVRIWGVEAVQAAIIMTVTGKHQQIREWERFSINGKSKRAAS